MNIEGGQTAFYDAVYLAMNKLTERKSSVQNDDKRRALIFITDGENKLSSFTFDELKKLIRKSDIQIFIIGLVNELDSEKGFVRGSKKEQATETLEFLAKETGGRVVYPKKSSEIPNAIEEIIRSLRKQYVIGFEPSGNLALEKGRYRKLKVEVVESKERGKVKVITRPGYVVP
jgi:Ca-activated chloride channel family protein